MISADGWGSVLAFLTKTNTREVYQYQARVEGRAWRAHLSADFTTLNASWASYGELGFTPPIARTVEPLFRRTLPSVGGADAEKQRREARRHRAVILQKTVYAWDFFNPNLTGWLPL